MIISVHLDAILFVTYKFCRTIQMFTWYWNLFREERCLATSEELVDFGSKFWFYEDIKLYCLVLQCHINYLCKNISSHVKSKKFCRQKYVKSFFCETMLTSLLQNTSLLQLLHILLSISCSRYYVFIPIFVNISWQFEMGALEFVPMDTYNYFLLIKITEIIRV